MGCFPITKWGIHTKYLETVQKKLSRTFESLKLELIKKYPEKTLYFENILFSDEDVIIKLVEKLIIMKNEIE